MLAVAVALPTIAVAQAPTLTHIAVEGGMACSRNTAYSELASGVDTVRIGNDGCGGTGALEIGRTGAAVFNVFDHWALRGRYTTFQDKGTAGTAFPVSGKFTDSRFVLDAEVGAKFNGISFFGGTSRIVVGLRFASWSANFDTVDALGDTNRDRMETTGFGPRIGLRSTIPLGTRFMYESQSGFAALYGRHSFDGAALDAARTSTVFSIDTSSALSYKFSESETGPVVSVGLASEYWFNQSAVGNGTDRINRHSWGPFLRLRTPLQ